MLPAERGCLCFIRLKHFRAEKIAMYLLNATLSLENIVKQVFKLRDIALGGWLTINNLAALLMLLEHILKRRNYQRAAGDQPWALCTLLMVTPMCFFLVFFL